MSKTTISHDMVIVTIQDGECDRGCCSYDHKELRCSCGHVEEFPTSYYPKAPPSFGPKEKHLFDVLLKKIGVEYTIKEIR